MLTIISFIIDNCCRRRIPPRTLIRLAHGYYDSETIQQLASDADGINLLHHPPQWAVASSIESDYIAKKRLKAAQTKLKEDQLKSEHSKSKSDELAHEAKYPHAVVAAGIGPDGDGDARRRKKRRKLLRTGAIFVGVLSIVLSMVDRDMFILPFSSNFKFTKVNAKPIVSVLHRSDKLQLKRKNARLSEPGTDFVDSIYQTESYENEPFYDEDGLPVDVIVIPRPPKEMPNESNKNEEQMKAQRPEETMKVDPFHEEVGDSNTFIRIRNFAQSYIIPDRNGITKESNPVQVVTALIQQHKVKPMIFYMQSKSLVSNLDTKELLHSVWREARMMAEIAKEALSDEAEIVLL